MKLKSHYDAIVVGSGHNGLIAAAYLSRAGKSVLVLEKNETFGGATQSQQVFPDYEAYLSRYSYLVSLLPDKIVNDLGLDFATKRREIASFTPYKDAAGIERGLLLSNVDETRSRDAVVELTGSHQDWRDYQTLLSLEREIADLVWPTMLEPLQSRQNYESRLTTAAQKEAWSSFVERPLGEVIERYIHNDVLRGLVMTDGKIGVFTHPHDDSLIQNRCFLYHVIGGGTGEWRVPVGGMRALVESLICVCRAQGVQFVSDAPVTAVHASPSNAEVEFNVGDTLNQISAGHVLINAGPHSFARMVGRQWKPQATDEGSVIKMNMLLHRLPKLRAAGIESLNAFCGSFHIDEGYEQMLTSYHSARNGMVPDPTPGEIYCHTLTDNSILSPELNAKGFQTLTLFGMDMPYRLFKTDHDARRQLVQDRFLAGLDRLCDEPFIDCVARDQNGEPCIEIKTPQDLEKEIDLDQGNIFHNSLSWFFTDEDVEVGRWGVETEFRNVLIAGSSAKRGGSFSGIPGYNAAMCVLEKD